MESASESNSKPGVLLLVVAVLLLSLRALLHYAAAMRKSGNLSYALGYSAARAVLAPMLFAALFCIPKKGRTHRRFAIGFVSVSSVMLLADLGEFGQSVRT